MRIWIIAALNLVVCNYNGKEFVSRYPEYDARGPVNTSVTDSYYESHPGVYTEVFDGSPAYEIGLTMIDKYVVLGCV